MCLCVAGERAGLNIKLTFESFISFHPQDFTSGFGAIQKVCHRARGRGSTGQPSGGTTSNKYRFNNNIRMTLEVAITPLYLHFGAHFSKYEI